MVGGTLWHCQKCSAKSLCYFTWCLSVTNIAFISVQLLSHVRLSATLWTAACQASLSFTNTWNLLRLTSVELVMPPNHFIFCHPLLLLPSVFPSIGVFSNESTLRIRWPNYWIFHFSISPSSEYSGLISFRIDWFYLLAVPGTLKSILQHHSSKALILQCSAFFIVQLSHPYMTTGKTIALTRWTFVGKVMSLLFNMLSRLAIVFLPRRKRLLISWLQSPLAVIYKVCYRLHCFSTYLPWSDGTGCQDLHFWMLSFKPVSFSLSSFTFIRRLFSSSSLSVLRVS